MQTIKNKRINGEKIQYWYDRFRFINKKHLYMYELKKDKITSILENVKKIKEYEAQVALLQNEMEKY